MSITTSRFNYQIQECHKRGDIGGALDTFRSFQVSQCYNPIKLRVYDSHTQTYIKRWFSCGKCYHCLETKINSWVTRMYAHLEDFKHVYFVTLTYRSVTPLACTEPNAPAFVSPLNELLLDKLSKAVWHLDDKNKFKHMCYSPCLLCKEHYQNFLKRLRKNTGFTDITYVLCGELGKIYGRPHFHLILFSNNPITEEQVRKAWSVALWRNDRGEWSYRTNQRKNGTAFDFPIGRIQFDDLVTNGTLNTSAQIKVDGTYMDASRCFAYVCKYVCKQDNANFSRLVLAYKNLFKNQTMCNDPELGICPLHVALARELKFGLTVVAETIKLNSYEETLFSPSYEVYGALPYNSRKSVCGKSVLVENYATEFADFRTQFKPFVEVSRGVPIGSLYAQNHIQEFAEGIFNKPLLQTRGFVVPLYFRNKAQHYIYGLRKMRKSIRGVSYPKTGLLDLYRRMESDLCGELPLTERIPIWQTSRPYNELLKDDSKVFRDLASGTKVILCSNRAMSFKYDRHTRTYVRVDQRPVQEWLSEQLNRLARDFKNYRTNERERLQSLSEKEQAFYLLARTTHQTPKKLRLQFEEEQSKYLSRRQREYDSIHVGVD